MNTQRLYWTRSLPRLGSLSPQRFIGHSSRTASSSASPNQDPKASTHFGFQTVAVERKQDMVAEVFHRVADRYDLMNDVMSVGIHRLWKQHLIQSLQPQSDTQLLDVAGGTGDLAFRFLDYCRQHAPSVSADQPLEPNYTAHVTVLDINPAMLQVGQQRAVRYGYAHPTEINWVLANAEYLPVASNSYDAYTIAFGIRNCTHLDRVLSEAYRVLKPGGRFMCLEFGHVQAEWLRPLYDQFSFGVIPMMGELVAQDRPSYQYLVESIRRFPSQPVFAQKIRDAGFKQVEWEDLTFGVAALHSGWKL